MNRFSFLDPKPKLITPQQKTFNLLVALCVHRGIDPATWDAMDLLGKCPNPRVIVRVKAGDALIDRSRSIVASRFLEQKDYDLLFFVDDDIVFNPIDLVKIAKVMKDKDLDIVGGAYVKKQETGTTFAIKSYDEETLVFGKEGGIQEVKMVSTGFMCINRRVLQTMVDQLQDELPLCHPGDLRFYPFFQPYPKKLEDGSSVYLSEDWAFCDRAERLGFKCWVDTTVKLGHAGRYVYNWDNLISPPKRQIESFKYTDLTSSVNVEEISGSTAN